MIAEIASRLLLSYSAVYSVHFILALSKSEGGLVQFW